MKIEPVILKSHKKYIKKPIGKFISSGIKDGELIVKSKIDKDFLDKINLCSVTE